MLPRLILILLMLVPSSGFSEMYKCLRQDGSIFHSNLACGSGQVLISIDGIPAAEIRRRENEEQKRLIAEQEKARAIAEEKQREEAHRDRLAAMRETATANGIRCEVEHRGGLVQKIITFSVDGKTYAINGQARGRAKSRGWEDGFIRFSPDQMQELIQDGLRKC